MASGLEGKIFEDYDYPGVYSSSLAPITINKCPFTSPIDPDNFVNFYNGCDDSPRVKTLLAALKAKHGIPSNKDEHYYGPAIQKWLEKSDTKTELALHSTPHQGYKGSKDMQMVVYFGTSSFCDWLHTNNRSDLKSKECMIMAWGNPIGNIPTLASFSTGVVGMKDCAEPPFSLENDKLPFLSGIKIPKVDSMKLKPFVITKTHYGALMGLEKVDYLVLKMIIGLDVNDEKDLQGLVFLQNKMSKFSDSYINSPLVKSLHVLLREHPSVILVGGVFSDVMSKGTPDDDIIATGFLVIGDRTKVKVQGTYFEGPKFSPSHLTKIVEIKDNLLKPKTGEKEASFALFFGSHERGMKLYDGEPGMDQRFFQAHLPETLMIGAYVPFQFVGALEKKDHAVFLVVSYLYNY